MDEKTNIKEIRNKVKALVNCRGWKRSPRNIAISICLEAAELLEHFQWDESKQDKEEIRLELADVMIYLCDLANEMDIDISDAVFKKMKKIDEKYPAELMLNGKEEAYFAQKKKYRENKK